MGPSCPLAICCIAALWKKKAFGHIINPLFTKLVRSRWLDIGLFRFYLLSSSTPSQSIKTQKKKSLAAILTSPFVNNEYGPLFVCSVEVLVKAGKGKFHRQGD